MMTDEQRYFFDINGYLLVPGAIAPDAVARMLATMNEHAIDPPETKTDDYRFGEFLRWSDDFRALIDHPVIMPVLEEMIGPKFRLDHAYGMAARTSKDGQVIPSEGTTLHHESAMFNYGCYYMTHGQKMANGLVVVSYSLTDIGPDAGGFCCIPGSHKALYPLPASLKPLSSPMVRQIPQAAGDALIFTESLTHGTWPWRDPSAQRRSVLMKYTPAHMQFAQKPMRSDFSGLSDRQKLILTGPSVWEREAIAYDQ